MINNIKIFENENFKVQTRFDPINNEIQFDAADVALCLNLVQVRIQNGKEYTKIRWSRLNDYVSDVAPQKGAIKKGDFINEAQLYMLCLKAHNELSIKLQIWLATDVLPSIRKYGAYISENADKETVDKVEKFSKYRIKKTFANASKNNIETLYNEFIDFTKTMKATDAITAYDSAIKGLEEFKVNAASDAYKMLALEKIQELTALKLTKKNRINGGLKAHKTKRIDSLENEIEEWRNYAFSLYPQDDEFIEIDIHPFSINSMYAINYKGEKVRSRAYNRWINNFPSITFPKLESDKIYRIYLEYENKQEFDTDNLSKSIVDQIVRITGVDDSNFITVSSTTINHVNSYEDGKIYVAIKEVA